MKRHTFTHEAPPKPKERPRQGKGGHIYTPKTTKDYEQSIKAAYDGPKHEGPVLVDVELYKDRAVIVVASLEGVTLADGPKLRGDIDNYLKAILDGLNGVAYSDDKQVFIARVEKVT